MDIKKIALLFAFAFVISGIVYYESWHSRHKGSSQPAATVTTPPKVSPPPVPIAVPLADLASDIPAPPPTTTVAVLGSPNGWGRNPFLTPEEIAKLHEAPKPVEVAKPVEVVVELPHYDVTMIMKDQHEVMVAMVNGNRTIHVGDRLGAETVKEISNERKSITLENAGKSRELFFPKR